MIWTIRKTQQKLFEGANKPGKYLAYQRKKKRERREISKILADGKEIVDKVGIKNAFLEFYSNLHKKNNIDPENLQKYISENKIPKLSTEDRTLMEDSIIIEEIEEAIMQMKTGKSPGIDGFTTKFYKTFKTELSHRFQIIGNDILEGKSMLQNAIISMILKQEDSTPNIKNFRPISLLNVEYKILLKLLERDSNGYRKGILQRTRQDFFHGGTLETK